MTYLARRRSRWPTLIALSLMIAAPALAREGSERDQAPETERVARDIGTFDEAQLRLTSIPMTIALVDGALMPAGWTLVNASRADGRLRSKEGPAWYHTLELDTDASGIADTEMSRPIYALLFRHGRTAATALVRLHPLPEWAGALDLRTLVDERIASDSAELSIATGRSPSGLLMTSGERVAVLRQQISVLVDEAPSIAFEYDIRSARRIELGLEGPVRRVRTLLIRSDWRVEMAGRKWPTIIEMTVNAAARDFDDMARDFDGLVQRAALRGDASTSEALVPMADDIEGCISRHGIGLGAMLELRLHPARSGVRLSYRIDSEPWSGDGKGPAAFERCLTDLLGGHPMAKKARDGFQVTMRYARPRRLPLDTPVYMPAIWTRAEAATTP